MFPVCSECNTTIYSGSCRNRCRQNRIINDVREKRLEVEGVVLQLGGRVIDLTHSKCPVCLRQHTNEYYAPFCDSQCWVRAGEPQGESDTKRVVEMLTIQEMREQSRQFDRPAQLAYECYF